MWTRLLAWFKDKKTSVVAPPLPNPEAVSSVDSQGKVFAQDSPLVNLSAEIVAMIFERLPFAAAFNAIVTSKKSKMLWLDEYSRSVLYEKFTDQLPADEILARFSDSRVEWDSNQQRFAFLKKNLLDSEKELEFSPADKLTYVFSSGCFYGQNVFKVFINLNCWKLFTTQWLSKLDKRSYSELVLLLPKIKTLPGFRFVVRNIFALKSELKKKALKYFHLSLKQEFSKEQLQVFLEEAESQSIEKELNLTSLEMGVIKKTDLEFSSLLQDKNIITKEANQEDPQGSGAFEAKSIFLAIQTKQDEKIKVLIANFKGKINDFLAKNLFIFSCKRNNLFAAELLLDNFPGLKDLNTIEAIVFEIIPKDPQAEIYGSENEVLKRVLEIYLKMIDSNKQKEFLTHYFANTNKDFHWAKLLHVLIAHLNNDVKKEIPSLIIDILNNTSEDFWSRRANSNEDDINQVAFRGITPAYIAVATGNVAAVKYLIANKVSLKDANILLLAIKNSYQELNINCDLIKVLVDAKLLHQSTNIFLVSSAVETEEMDILKAIYNKDTRKYLSRNHADIHKAFGHAVKINNIKMVEYLLEMYPQMKVDVTKILQDTSKSGQSLDAAILAKLVDHPLSNLSPIDLLGWGEDALYYAIKMGRQDFVELLIAKNYDINRIYKLQSATPFSVAIGEKKYDIAELLLQHGADPCPMGTNLPGRYNSRQLTHFPLYVLITQCHVSSNSVSQRNKLIKVMLSKIKQSPKSYYSGLLNSYAPYFKLEEFARWSMGVELIIRAVERLIPIDIIEMMVDNLSFDLNSPCVDNANVDQHTLFKVLVNKLVERRSNEEYLKSVILKLIKKGLNCFVRQNDIYWYGVAQLARFGIGIGEIGFEKITPEVMNDLVQQHETFINKIISEPARYGKDDKIRVIENLQKILLNEKFHGNVIEFSFGNWSSKCKIVKYFELLCLAFNEDCDLLFENRSNNNTLSEHSVENLCAYADTSGQNLLHHGAVKGLKKFITKLLNANVLDINQIDKAGNTALHLALEANKNEIVNVLLSQPNIKLNIKNKKGKSAWDLISREPNLVSMVINSPQLQVQLAQLDITGSFRIAYLLSQRISAIEIFDEVREQFNPYKVLESFDQSINETDKTLFVLRLIKDYSETTPGLSFLPNNKTLQFIRDQCSKKLSTSEPSLVENLAKELNDKYPERKWYSDFFNGEQKNDALASQNKTYEDFSKSHFLKIQR